MASDIQKTLWGMFTIAGMLYGVLLNLYGFWGFPLIFVMQFWLIALANKSEVTENGN